MNYATMLIILTLLSGCAKAPVNFYHDQSTPIITEYPNWTEILTAAEMIKSGDARGGTRVQTITCKDFVYVITVDDLKKMTTDEVRDFCILTIVGRGMGEEAIETVAPLCEKLLPQWVLENNRYKREVKDGD